MYLKEERDMIASVFLFLNLMSSLWFHVLFLDTMQTF